MAERPRRRRGRRLAIGAGLAAAAAAGAVAAQHLAARRLRARPDPDDVDLTEMPAEDLGPVRSIEGTALAVRAAGPPDAPGVVFLHALSLDMTTWHYQWKAFSNRYRCVIYDARGHGRSGRPPREGDHSLEAMGRDVRAVLDAAIPAGPAILVGHSMGGMALLSFARQFPEEFGERVVGAVFVDTSASDVLREVFGGLGARVGRALRRVGDRYSARPELAERLQRRIRRFGTDVAFLVAWATNFGPGASPSLVEHITRVSSSAPPQVWAHGLRDIVEMDLRQALEHVTVPSLVVVGDRDLVTPKTSAQALRAALPDARAVVITGAGHISMMERPDVFNDVLGRYLDQVIAAQRPSRRRRSRRRRTEARA